MTRRYPRIGCEGLQGHHKPTAWERGATPEPIACTRPLGRHPHYHFALALRAELTFITEDRKRFRIELGVGGFEHPRQTGLVDDFYAMLSRVRIGHAGGDWCNVGFIQIGLVI